MGRWSSLFDSNSNQGGEGEPSAGVGRLIGETTARLEVSPPGGMQSAEAAAARVQGLPKSAGRWLRGSVGQQALEDLYGPGEKNVEFPTQYGGREPDLVVRNEGRIEAHESSVAAGSVRAGTHKLKEALKDFELMQYVPGYTPIWHFWDGPPTPALAQTLDAFGIRYIVYRH